VYSLFIDLVKCQNNKVGRTSPTNVVKTGMLI
jgi:hypothetical protein